MKLIKTKEKRLSKRLIICILNKKNNEKNKNNRSQKLLNNFF